MLPALPACAGASDPAPVIPSIAFDALLGRRELAVAALRKIAEGVTEYGAVAAALWPPKGGEEDDGRPVSWRAPYTYRDPVNHRPQGRGAHLDEPEGWLRDGIAAVDASLWDHLLDASGLRTFLDAKAREEWAKQIEERRTPPLTPDNVRATFETLHARRGEFFERGVIGVFRSLSWDYKTNRPQAFGRRIVLTHVMSGGYPHTQRTDVLDDLERAFHILDRQPEPDHRQGISSRLWKEKGGLSTPYMALRTFKNGNGHVTFLRPDLVDELNRILARHYPGALPPARD